MTRLGGRRLLLAAVVAAAVIAAVVVAFARSGDDVRPGGPVNVAAQDRVSSRFRTGQTGSAGWITLQNLGQEPARIESVRPVGVDPGLVIERVYAVGHARPMMGYSATERWPASSSNSMAFPPELLEDPSKVTVLPDSQVPDGEALGVALVIVLRADRPGDYAFRGVAVRYRVGDQQYRRVVTNAFTMCVSARATRRCTPKPGFDAEQAAER